MDDITNAAKMRDFTKTTCAQCKYFARYDYHNYLKGVYGNCEQFDEEMRADLLACEKYQRRGEMKCWNFV